MFYIMPHIPIRFKVTRLDGASFRHRMSCLAFAVFATPSELVVLTRPTTREHG